MHSFAAVRHARIRHANPHASEQELLALLTEETYRDSVPPERLTQLCDMIRRDTPER